MDAAFEGSCDRGTAWARAVAVAGALAELGVTELGTTVETEVAFVEGQCRQTDLPGALVAALDEFLSVQLATPDRRVVVVCTLQSVRWTCRDAADAAVFEACMPLG